ncbi:snRNA-activating protein complex subunit-like [Pyrus ussuriensis x Pyrus communis]|uniref:snRNA-activating protein complex subunit-like n=1 Tax=Pyrus ussuriensis x Pyrus communis TaxID=2448454 RepID=A0A5N5G643_9ROSA|nr:snRNA-activating protein complex subunit-like [Pyrus ussuriensis x Pyrus communis]
MTFVLWWSRAQMKLKRRAYAMVEKQGETYYIARVKRVKRMKEKQGEDKAAVTLHSFNRSSKTIEPSIASSRTIDRMKPLRSASSSVKECLESDLKPNVVR